MDATKEQEDAKLDNLPPIFDEKVMSKAVGKSVKWAQQARIRGTGPKFKKLDGSIRYTREDTLQWIKDSTRQSTSQNQGRAL